MTHAEMETLVGKLERQFGSKWRDIVAWMRDQHSVDDLERAIQMGDYSGVLATVKTAAEAFATDVHAGYVTSAQKASDWLDGLTTDSLVRFDQQNVRAVRWAQQNQYDRIVGITEEQRSVIARVVTEGIAAGRNPRDVARDLRGSIGLTDAQVQIVSNYRRQLESNDPAQLRAALQRELADGRYDRGVERAIEDATPIDPERIDTMVEAYRRNFVNLRAETIARTEGLRAAHEGTEAAYTQAIERGDVDADELIRVWNTAHDARVRDSHARMNGQERKFGEQFLSGAGVPLRYPGDPNAPIGETINERCVLSTRFAPAEATAKRLAAFLAALGLRALPANDNERERWLVAKLARLAA